MRSDRIVVGEVRGGECLDMLQAMITRHDRSISTVHANSRRDAIARPDTLGVDASGRFLGKPVPSGVRPRFTDRFAELGIPISATVFGAQPARGRSPCFRSLR
ncbi:hypothetical protein ACVWZ8_002594 [Arthrobacter sp. UYCu723]